MSEIDLYLSEDQDVVNHPDHYISDSGIETIDVIEAFTKDLGPFEAYCTGNIIKYICRWKHKNGKEDLKKARWYINRLLGENEKTEDIQDHIMEANAHYHNIADPSSKWNRVEDGIFLKNDYMVVNLSDVDWEDILSVSVGCKGISITYKTEPIRCFGPPFPPPSQK